MLRAYRPDHFLWVLNCMIPSPMKQLLPTLILALVSLSTQAQTETRTTYFSGGSEL